LSNDINTLITNKVIAFFLIFNYWKFYLTF
jgi:hypothetical protein